MSNDCCEETGKIRIRDCDVSCLGQEVQSDSSDWSGMFAHWGD